MMISSPDRSLVIRRQKRGDLRPHFESGPDHLTAQVILSLSPAMSPLAGIRPTRHCACMHTGPLIC